MAPFDRLLSSILLLVLTTCGFAQTDYLIRGATIVTWNETTQAVESYRGRSIYIQDDEIRKIYTSDDEVLERDVEIVEANDKIVVPGFISTHHHVWQTLYRTLIPDLPFASYFPRLGHVAPISSTLNVDEVFQSELMGALELLNEGTTSWVDITSALSPETVDAAWRATFASGGRSFFAATLQPKESFTEAAQIAQMRELANRPELINQSMVTLGLNYDGFETSTTDSRTAVLDLVSSGAIQFITTHYVGGPFGNTNSPALLHDTEWSLLNGTMPVIFSHASHVTPLDASLLRATNQYISLAPESESHFGHGNAHSHLILDQAALAADSVFGYSTSIVQQARLWLQQVRGRLSQLHVDQWRVNTNTPMTVKQAFYLATRAGGLALRRSDLGIIEEGAKADLVFYDTSKPNLFGWRDPVAAVILHSNPADVSDVIVGGKFVKRNNKLTYGDLNQLIQDFKTSALEFEERYNHYDFGPVPEWFTLATYENVTQVDVVRGNATGY